MKRKHDNLIGLTVGSISGVFTAIVVMLLMYLLTGCGVEARQEQDVQARIEIYYPNCAEVEDDELMVECIKAASSIKIEADGIESISTDEQELLDNLDIEGES